MKLKQIEVHRIVEKRSELIVARDSLAWAVQNLKFRQDREAQEQQAI